MLTTRPAPCPSAPTFARNVGLAIALLGSAAVRGEDPPWRAMDYGPFIATAIEIDAEDIVYKGIAVDLDGPHGEAMLFDPSLLRWACGWTGDFVALHGIVYDGPHGVHSGLAGAPAWRNAVLPGAVAPGAEHADPRTSPYGPLPRAYGAWQGVLTCGREVAMSYRAAGVDILDAPSVVTHDGFTAYRRTIEFTGAEGGVRLAVARMPRVGTEDIAARVVGPGAAVVLDDSSAWLELAPRETAQTVDLVFAPVRNNEERARFAALARTIESPRGLDRFRAGGEPLWKSALDRAGRLDVRDAASDVVATIVRPPDGAPLAHTVVRAGAGRVRVQSRRDNANPARARVADTVLVVDPALMGMPAPRAAFTFDEGEGERMRDSVSGAPSLRLDGATWRRGVRGRSLDFDGTASAEWTGGDLDPEAGAFTVAAWIHTSKDGTIVARAAREGRWAPNGWTFFVRDGRLGFDVGWVGAVEGDRVVADAAWHHVACSYDAGRVQLFLDGEREADGVLPVKGGVEAAVVRLGFTAPDFPAEPYFSGYIDGVTIFAEALGADVMPTVATRTGEPIVEIYGVRGSAGDVAWADTGGIWALVSGPSERPLRLELARWRGPASAGTRFIESLDEVDAYRPFTIDAISWPDANPWHSWMRFGAFDFIGGGSGAVITTWSGDVWRVDGLDATLDALRWQRIATGLNQPLGIAVRDGAVFVLGRDQITRLDDLDEDGETDRYTCFSDLMLNSEHFHEPASGLIVEPDGGFVYLKAARHAKQAAHEQHGTLIRVAPDGRTLDVLASGFRAPLGLWRDDDGTYYGSDQEGHWMPANRINAIRPGGFYGNNWSGTGAPRDEHDPPLVWAHPAVDRSPSAQLRLHSESWGDLDGALLGLSYGTGEVYRILEDDIDGVRQGGIVKLPIRLPTGLLCGKVNPRDGHLYVAGLFGWSSDATQPGGFYRVRATGPTPLSPMHVRATPRGLRIRFNRPLDPESLARADAFRVTAWNYDWSERYGSPTFALDGTPGRTELRVRGVRPLGDGATVMVEVAGMSPAMQMHVAYDVRGAEGEIARGAAELTVHVLAGEE